MRLLFVGTKRGGGGAETHMLELARALALEGHAVAAVVHPEGFIQHALIANGAIRLYNARFSRATDPAGTLALLRAARDFRPQWIITAFKQEYYSAAMVARATGARVAFFEHTDLPKRRLSMFALPRICDEFVVPSQYLRAHLLARGVPPQRINVLYNPVDVERLHPDGDLRAAVRRELGFASEDVVVGYVGRIEPAKGSPVLAAALSRAMATDARIHALWVGDGRWMGELAQHIDAHGENARHVRTGWVADPTSYYAAMDVLALPTTKAETFGRASVEAQACGVPVLGSALGGIPETLLPGETGMLLPAGDVQAWSNAVLQMTNTGARAAMATRAPHFIAERFAARNIARRFVGMLQAHERQT